MNLLKKLSCDIFCTVVDNYGDIGVCWRLAKQLANEHAVFVTLWVDDLHSFRKLCHEIDVNKLVQLQHNVVVRRWEKTFTEVAPAQLVIEAFACELPENYVLAMSDLEQPPVWINLEYLSAEDWVAGCHGLPSPHPRLPLVKHFFFPGFTRDTGGVLLEQDLFSKRDLFISNVAGQDKYWEMLGVPARRENEVRVSLFSYENIALPSLLSEWVVGPHPMTCLVPEGRVLPQVAAFFGRTGAVAGDTLQQGQLKVYVLPFVEQDEYDKLLWACDINFVRGEDSCVRAQWAGKPFVWQIYPQHDGVHLQKMRALLGLYCAGLPPASAQAVHAMWECWNTGESVESFDFSSCSNGKTPWNDFLAQQLELGQHADAWANKLSANNLALNLLDFSRKVGRIAPFEI